MVDFSTANGGGQGLLVLESDFAPFSFGALPVLPSVLVQCLDLIALGIGQIELVQRSAKQEARWILEVFFLVPVMVFVFNRGRIFLDSLRFGELGGFWVDRRSCFPLVVAPRAEEPEAET